MAATPSHSTVLLGGDLEINRLGYGCMQLTGAGVWGEVGDRENAKKVLQEAVASGVNFFDTADAYGPDTNEILIDDALHPYAKGLVIATKGGFMRTGPGVWVANGTPEHIHEAIEGSLKRLKVPHIDLWQLHRIDPKVPVEETLAPVLEAVKSGKIKHVGLSEVSIGEIERAEKVLPIVSVQNMYNIGTRKWDAVVDYTAQRKIAFIPWFPLASDPDKLADRIKSVAHAHKATTAQIALAWLLHRSPNIVVIPGTKSIAHLHENVAASQVTLSDEEYQELSK
jgi:pyridoxine 4-dehydrogenase